ncbi:UDP-N-acetylmuramoyl-tripeptide--D-alanyl-D-alanine ligase [Candidatus Atribacteria bacterium 1244-E10-H5-B2]|nr:MAG: UDP-N-acetylmuramoyl-tripeptide--D-alanyl-D-alanine ligase [Candidatus Atribacteria bacterium 1244-E10-H5-B2]
MENCKIKEFIKAVSGKIIQGDRDCLISRISIDSRTLIPGDLFFAIIGPSFDGHDFIIEAFNKGAVGAVACKSVSSLLQNEEIDKNKVIVEVKDTLSALQNWSKHYKDKFKTFNICVTGSNGKTTTKEIIAHILSQEFPLLKTSGNYNNEIGIPLTLLQLNKSHKILVVEMGMRGLGEIKTLTNFIPPDLALITNIGEAHIGLLGSKNNIFKAKSELLQSLDKDGMAIINKDDPYFFKMLEIVKGKKVYTFGIENDSDIMACNIRIVSDKGIRFTLEVQNDKRREIYFPLLGRHNIYNALAASAVAFALGIELDLIERGLFSFKPLDLHMQLSNFYNGIKILNDSYNASPISVKSALETLTEVAQNNRKIAILGDMLELGEKTDFYHREVGKEVTELSIDTLITVGRGGKIIAQSSKEKGMAEKRVFSFEKNEKRILAKKLLNLTKPGDFILLKGSREMKMEEILEFLQKEYQKNNPT